jgi:hypothetical protein
VAVMSAVLAAWVRAATVMMSPGPVMGWSGMVGSSLIGY